MVCCRNRITKRIIPILQIIEIMDPDYLKHGLDYMYDYVYILYAFVKILDTPPVIVCLSCHSGPLLEIVIRVLEKGSAEEPHSS